MKGSVVNISRFLSNLGFFFPTVKYLYCTTLKSKNPIRRGCKTGLSYPLFIYSEAIPKVFLEFFERKNFGMII